MKPETLGQYVTQARIEHGLSIRQLAAQLGVEPSTISRLEDGSRGLPHPDLFLALIDALDLDVDTALKLAEPYHRLYRGLRSRMSNVRTDGRSGKGGI